MNKGVLNRTKARIFKVGFYLLRMNIFRSNILLNYLISNVIIIQKIIRRRCKLC